MKVLIYTDLHCSFTSGILPLYLNNEDRYTTRLRMIVNTGKWLSEVAKSESVDCIVNGGDTFDSNVVRAEEITAMSDFFSYFADCEIPHYIIMGNHEKLDNSSIFHSSKAFSNIENVTVIDKPMVVNDYLSVIPYIPTEMINNELVKPLKNKLLVSHLDIKGSHIRPDFIMDDGVAPELLSEYFDFVANGHLHTYEHINTSKNCVENVGSCSSISFIDNNQYIPSCIVYDTDTKKYERFENPYSILFRRFNSDSVKSCMESLNGLPNNHMYAVRVTCPFDLKTDIKTVLENSDKVIAYRIQVDDVKKTNHKTELVLENVDLKQGFIDFLSSGDIELKYDLDLYKKVLGEVL